MSAIYHKVISGEEQRKKVAEQKVAAGSSVADLLSDDLRCGRMVAASAASDESCCGCCCNGCVGPLEPLSVAALDRVGNRVDVVGIVIGARVAVLQLEEVGTWRSHRLNSWQCCCADVDEWEGCASGTLPVQRVVELLLAFEAQKLQPSRRMLHVHFPPSQFVAPVVGQ